MAELNERYDGCPTGSAVITGAGDQAFVAVDRDAGTAVCWGSPSMGGACPSEPVDWSVVELFAECECRIRPTECGPVTCSE